MDDNDISNIINNAINCPNCGTKKTNNRKCSNCGMEFDSVGSQREVDKIMMGANKSSFNRNRLIICSFIILVFILFIFFFLHFM